ncbi:MAG: FlxA-like family protein [Synechococcus sp. BS307-5m-G38]|nr:FlxA-like family protein [Synechococcus sp. BS307-5m-G38]
MGGSDGRLSPLLRWLGLTLVVILVLQMAAVLVGVDWSDQANRPQVTGPLVALAPLGFLGLLVALLGSRLDVPKRRHTPLRWLICVLSIVLALGMVAAVPLSLDSGSGNVERAENLEQGRQALKEARTFREDEARVKAVGEQLAQAGQLAEDATDEDKLRAAEKMIDEQIAQMDQQISKVERQQSRESQQRLIGGTTSAVVLAVAFVLLALTSVL